MFVELTLSSVRTCGASRGDPIIKTVANEVRRHGRLLHLHFHGKCMKTVSDFFEIGVDCVCPFERPPGSGVDRLNDLREVARQLGQRATMNGNIPTVNILIRGTQQDVAVRVRRYSRPLPATPGTSPVPAVRSG